MPLPSPHPHLTPVFVGREKEIEEALSFIRGAKANGGILIIQGTAGVGKSRFIDELLRRITEDTGEMKSWRAAGKGVDHHPLHPFRSILPWREMVKEARVNFPTAVVPNLEDRYLLFNAVVRRIDETLKSNPAVLVMDDMHLCDETSIYLLHYILLSKTPLPVIAALSPEILDKRSSLGQTLLIMRRERLITSIDLEPLRDKYIDRLTSNMLGRRPGNVVLEKIRSISEGNPSFAVQTVQSFMAEGILVFKESAWDFAEDIEDFPFPNTIESLLKSKISSLSDEGKSVLSASSVLGHDFSFKALTHMVDMDEDTAIDIVESLVMKGIFVPLEGHNSLWDDEEYSFVTNLLQIMAYESIPEEDRERMHISAAQALESCVKGNRGRRDDLLPLMANHYYLGGDTGRALPLFIGAGKRAESVGAFVDAMELYNKAVAIMDHSPAAPSQVYVRCLLDTARMENIIGDMNSAKKKLELARDESRKNGLRKMEIEAKIYLDELLIVGEKYKKAETACLTTLQDAVLLGDLAHVGWCFERLGQIYWIVGRLKSAKDALENGLSYTIATGDFNMGEKITMDLANVFASIGDFEESLSRYSLAIHMLDEHPNKYEEARVYIGMASVYGLMGEEETSSELFSKAVEISRAIGAKRLTAKAYLKMAETLVLKDDQGSIAEAENCVFRAMDAVDIASTRIDMARSFRIKGIVALSRGQMDTAETLFSEAMDMIESMGVLELESEIFYSMSKIYVAKGNKAEALVSLEKAVSRLKTMGADKRAEDVRNFIKELISIDIEHPAF